MKRILSLSLVLLPFALLALLTLHWQPSHEETVFVHNGDKLHIEYAVKPCLCLGWRHATGVYLYPGATRLNIREAKAGEVVINEELSLFAAHSLSNSTYLIFECVYKPERGFLAFKVIDNSSFETIPVRDIPPEIAYPNIGLRFEKFKNFLSSAPTLPPDFFHSKTARLWSQIATGHSVEEEKMSVEEVEKFWILWTPRMKKRIGVQANL